MKNRRFNSLNEILNTIKQEEIEFEMLYDDLRVKSMGKKDDVNPILETSNKKLR